MLLINAAVLVGLVLLYFVNAALKIDIFNSEMFVHSSLRFCTGFLVLGVGYFYEHKIGLKLSVYLVMAFLLGDDILDYTRGVNSLSAEMMLHGIYMLIWGSVVGYCTIRFLKSKLRD